MSAIKSILYSFLLCAFFLLITGCAGISSSSGGLQKRMEVEQLFESGTLLPDHTYYTDGPESDPNAIIAISNRFQLQTKVWSQKDWVAEDLEKAVYWMQFAEYGFCDTEGGVLIAPDGQQIGIWYSKKDIGTIRQPAPGIVEVFPFIYGAGSPCQRQAIFDDL